MKLLPHRDSDPILRLHAHYFSLASLMRDNAKRIDAELAKKGRISKNKDIDHTHYIVTWLSFLYVVIEGLTDLRKKCAFSNLPEHFHESNLKADELLSFSSKHINSLRIFRNGTFHYQETPDKQVQFLQTSPRILNWSDQLHDMLDDFFSKYRVSCMIVYALEGRMEEQFR